MQTAVAVRRFARNTARTAVSAPSTFVAIASRVVSVDRLEIALRGEFDGTLDAAKRHARRLANAVADRFGTSACAEIHSHDGVPLFFTEARR